MTSGDIYIFSGLGGAGVDESDSFTNWTGTDCAFRWIAITVSI
jgi:hypothetical protein